MIFLAAKGSKYLGCFLEENLLTLGDESRAITPMSPDSCSRFCTGKQYMFFILKHEYDFIYLILFTYKIYLQIIRILKWVYNV